MNEKYENGNADYEQEYHFLNDQKFAVSFYTLSGGYQTKYINAPTRDLALDIVLRDYNVDTRYGMSVARIGELN